jgi:hypothetical protein
MYIYSQCKLQVAPTEPEHIIRKKDLDMVIGDLSLLKTLKKKKLVSIINVIAALMHSRHRQSFAIGEIIGLDSNGRATVQLLDATRTPAGKIIRNVILLHVAKNTLEANETSKRKLVFVVKQASVKFGIPLNMMNCSCQQIHVDQTFSEATMDKEFFQNEIDIVRLDNNRNNDER